MEEDNEFEQVVSQVEELVSKAPDFHWIKMGDQQIRLFKSFSNKRLEGETFGEYKVRLKINSKMLKIHKNGNPL